jgi:hypothetical protein
VRSIRPITCPSCGEIRAIMSECQDICINLAFDELEFIELVDDFGAVFYEYVTGFPKGVRVSVV